MSLVGCSQFLSSYLAWGGESIMWKVYANRVRGLVFRFDLCNTAPWIRTRSPMGRAEKNNGSIIHTTQGILRKERTWIAGDDDIIVVWGCRALLGSRSKWLKSRSLTVRKTHKTFSDRRNEMRSRLEIQGTIGLCTFLQGYPKPEGSRRFGILKFVQRKKRDLTEQAVKFERRNRGLPTKKVLKTIQARFFRMHYSFAHFEKTYESLCSGTVVAWKPALELSSDQFIRRVDAPSPPMCGCLMITIDCSAEDSSSHHISVVQQTERSAPTGSLWNLRSVTRSFKRWFSKVTLRNAGSNSWRAAKKKSFFVLFERPHNLKRIPITDHAQFYSQLSASPLPTFLQIVLHLPPRNNDCFFRG